MKALITSLDDTRVYSEQQGNGARAAGKVITSEISHTPRTKQRSPRTQTKVSGKRCRLNYGGLSAASRLSANFSVEESQSILHRPWLADASATTRLSGLVASGIILCKSLA